MFVVLVSVGVAAICVDFFLQHLDLLLVLGPFCLKLVFVAPHSIHIVFFFFTELVLQTLVHIVEVVFTIGSFIFTFYQCFNRYLELIDVNLILFLSSLILLHQMITGCQISLMLIDSIFKHSYL